MILRIFSEDQGRLFDDCCFSVPLPLDQKVKYFTNLVISSSWYIIYIASLPLSLL